MSAGPPAFTNQAPFEARFEWGEAGLRALAPYVQTIIIVDVLSFSTAVDVAVSQGALILPVPWKDERATDLAREQGALLAVPRRLASPEHPYSLSPGTLQSLLTGSKLVLPSPNGATLAAIAAGYGVTVLAGSLRNGSAVGRFCRDQPGDVAVIAAGERWGVESGSLRFSLEDLLGAGAILAAMRPRSTSPEARSAIATFLDAKPFLGEVIRATVSGRELIEGGFAGDVEIAVDWDASDTVPILQGAYFVNDNQRIEPR